jgi:hypothetical protein
LTKKESLQLRKVAAINQLNNERILKHFRSGRWDADRAYQAVQVIRKNLARAKLAAKGRALTEEDVRRRRIAKYGNDCIVIITSTRFYVKEIGPRKEKPSGLLF